MWGFAQGFGEKDRIYDLLNTSTPYTSSMLATTTPEARIGFFLLDGSYFGDFNKDQDFMRASIATPNYGFAAMWAQPWNLSSMSLGEHLGTVFRRTVDTFDRKRENAIMGDPTLRFYQIVPPPSNVTLANGSLTWTALANTTYFIAGAITTLGPYTELGT